MKKRIKKSISKLFKITVIVFLAAILVFSWQLYRHGVNLGVIASVAEKALNPEGSNYKVSLGEVKFSFARRAVPVALNVHNVTVTDKDGRKVASIDELTTYLSASALIRGMFAPSEIVLYKPRISMFVDEKGSVGIGFNENEAGMDLLSIEQSSFSGDLDDVQMLYNILDFNENAFGRYSYLEKLNVVGGSLFFKETATKTFWFFPKIDVKLARTGEMITIGGDMDLRQRNKQTAHIKVDASAEKKKMRAKAYFVNFTLPDRVADFILAEARVSMPLSGEMSMVIDLDKEKPVKSILLRLDELNFSFSGDKGALILPDPILASYDVKSFLIEGYAKNGLTDVKLSKISAKTETGAYAWGEADIRNLNKVVVSDYSEKLVMDFSLHARDITIEALKDYWPASLGPSAHEWVVENISAGVVEDGSFNLVFERDENGDVSPVKTDGIVKIKDGVVRYIDTLPVVTNVNGYLNITREDVRIIIENGDSNGLKLYSADLYFYDIWEEQEKAKMLLRIKGGISDALSLLDMPPFGFITGLGLPISGAEGQADTVVALDFPLRKDLTLDKVIVDVKAAINAKKINVDEFSLSDADMSLDVDNKEISVEGNGVLNNTKVNFSWNEIFEGEKAGRTLNADMILDTSARKAFGADIYPIDAKNLDGLVKLDISVKTDKNNNGEISVSADLTSALMKNDIIGLYKERNKPATAEAVIKRKGGKIESVPKFSLNAGRRTEINGSVSFNDKGGLSKINIDKAKLQGADFKAEIDVKEDAWNIKANGSAFNAERLVGSFAESDDEGGEFDLPAVKITASFDEVWLSKEGNMHKADLNLVFDKKGEKHGLLTANTVTGKKFKLTMGKANNGKTKIVVEGDDVGSVLKAVGATTNIRGGIMRGYAYMDDDLNLDGKIIVKDFALVKAETLSRVLKIASLTGVLGLLQGEGLDFDLAVIPFAYSDASWKVKDAVVSGFSLGLTGEGYLKGEKINMEGNVVPAYAFNSFLGKIPLVGNFFTSEDGGGLISFKYYIEGPMQNPEVTVNPLSALAPGVVRKLFDKNVLAEEMSEKAE